MCLRTGSFISSTAVFWAHEVHKIRKWGHFSTCFCGLVDRILDWYAKGPRFKTHLRLTKNSYFYRNFVFFSTFFQKWILSNETASPQTNFGLYNIGSKRLWDRVKAIQIWQILNETPCRTSIIHWMNSGCSKDSQICFFCICAIWLSDPPATGK